MRRAEIGSRPENGSSQSRITGLRDDRARQRDALDHAARELAGQQIVDVGEADRGERLVDASRRSRARRARCARAAGRRGCRRPSSSRAARRPGTSCRASARTSYMLPLRQPGDVLAVDDDAARLRLDQARRSGAGWCSCPSRCRRGSRRSCRAGSRTRDPRNTCRCRTPCRRGRRKCGHPGSA